MSLSVTRFPPIARAEPSSSFLDKSSSRSSIARARSMTNLFAVTTFSNISRFSSLATLPPVSCHTLMNLPTVISAIILDYIEPSELLLITRLAEARETVDIYLDHKEALQMKKFHKLKIDLNLINTLVRETSNSTLGLIPSDSKNRLWEVPATSLRSPRNDTGKGENISPKMKKTLEKTRTKLEINLMIKNKIAAANSNLSQSEVNHLIKIRQKLGLKVSSDNTKILSEEKRALEQKIKKIELSARDYFPNRIYKTEETETEIKKLYYSALFSIRYLSSKDKNLKTAFDLFAENNKSDLLDKASSDQERVIYASAERRTPNTPSSLYLISPNSTRRSLPGELFNAHEGELIESNDQNGSLVIIPNQMKIANLMNAPTLIPPLLFEEAISDSGR